MGASLHAQTPLFDRFFDEYYFRFNPTAGTAAGFHQFDSKLENYSKATIDRKTAVLHGFDIEFSRLPESDDCDLVLSKIHSDLLELEAIRMWERNPDTYSSGITNSIFVLMARKFAPQPERLRSVIAREKQIPQVFAEARINLRNPPRIYTDIALEQLPGLIQFFAKDVPSAFDEVRDEKLLDEFKASNEAVIDALKAYQKFLQTDMVPRSRGDFRLGYDLYRRKLEYDEMVTTPLEDLLKIGYADLSANQAEFALICRQIDPHKTPRQILEEVERDHPPADQLLSSFRNILGGLRSFILQNKIIDIPSPVPPVLEETPPFMRATTFASMDTPGPYEKVAKEAFFNVTLPESNWTKKQTDEFMEAFNRGTITSTAIHEAYPGHYVQFLWVQQLTSKVRKLLGANTNAEGWAHYTEQMMFEQGYAAGDLKLRLGQLQDALLRDARFIVGIQIHTGDMNLEQAMEFFDKEGYQPKPTAERETKRGTADPTYLYYTLGKLEILKLRDDYRKQKGAAFDLRQFHDEFMKQGFPPIQIVRHALVGRTGSVL